MHQHTKTATAARTHTPATPCVLYGLGRDGRLTYASAVSDLRALYADADDLARFLPAAGTPLTRLCGRIRSGA